MKKSLLALAVLGAISSAAFAQDSSVTLYGLVDAGLVHEMGGADSVNKITSGVKNGSRFGIKGNEDLGGGLAANFVLENGFNVDTGALGQSSDTNRIFGRQAYVGLSGGFGAVNLGRQYTPAYLALSKIDPFEVGTAGRANNLFWDTGVRMDNTVKYDTPADIGGFSASLAYGFGEQAGTSDGRQYGVSVGYGNGPVDAVLTYHNATSTSGADVGKQILVGGSYDFGVAKANIGFDTEKSDAGINARNWLLGGSVPLGSGTVLASYVYHKDRSGADQNTSQIAVGYVYALSKRTNFYTAYSRIKDALPAGVLLAPGTVGNATEAGSGNRAFNIGIQHKF